jgi:hypothetical protein
MIAPNTSGRTVETSVAGVDLGVVVVGVKPVKP